MDYTVEISHRQQLSVLLRTIVVSSRRVKVEEYIVGLFFTLLALALQAKK
jgi:hypothetical protein